MVIIIEAKLYKCLLHVQMEINILKQNHFLCTGMKKIELEIIALTHSITQTQSYAVVLGEVNGTRRLPIVIGGFEAQAITVALENMRPSRPLTHDLIKNMMKAFGLELQEVVINDLSEGIFFSKLVCFNDHDVIEIDSRTSDALALAVRFNCPIYTYESILENAGITIDESAISKEAKTEAFAATPEPADKNNLSSLSKDELQALLDEVLENEDYIKAIEIRDELKKRKR